jgi:uncharacterized membrane protein
MAIEFGKKPSAWIPVAMSLAALGLVGIQLATHGVQPERDEGAVAHLWQLLMVAQLPVIAFFAFRWLRQSPRQALPFFLAQLIAAVTSLVSVHWMGW